MEGRVSGLAVIGGAERFRKFYRLLCDTIGIKLVLIELGGRGFATLDHERDNAPLCSFMQRNGEFSALCHKCDRENSEHVQSDGRGLLYRCHAGLYDLVVPIYIDGRPRYAFLGGQILPEPPSKKGFAALERKVRRFNFDRAALRAAYFKMPSFPPGRLGKMLELIEFFAGYIQELGPRLFEDAPDSTDVVSRAKAFVEAHFREPISLKSVAAEMGVSASYLCLAFRRSAGTGFAGRLRRLRTAEAAKLLRETELRMDKVAKNSGFSSVRSFDRCFKLDYGETPRGYRKATPI